MSAKLDWQIESDRTEERADTDPLLRRQRRQRQLGLFFGTLGLVAIIAGAGAAIALRLRSIDYTLRQGLIAAAQAEVTDLKLGGIDRHYPKLPRTALQCKVIHWGGAIARIAKGNVLPLLRPVFSATLKFMIPR